MSRTLETRVSRLEQETGINGSEPVQVVIICAVEPTQDGSAPGPGKAVFADILGTTDRPGRRLHREKEEAENQLAERVEEARREVWDNHHAGTFWGP